MGRLLSVDPLMKKYPELTPYQFASNSPISGIDLDGLEFMKYDKKNTATIIFPHNQYNSDATIKKEFEYAMKAHMNVLVAGSISEINKFLGEKGNTYKNLLFTGHGGFNSSSLRIGNYGYHASVIEEYKSDLNGLGKYVTKNGTIALLACFQATPKYEEKGFKYKGESYDIKLDGEAITKRLSHLTGRKVLGNGGETYSGYLEFSGSYIQNYVASEPELHNLSARFAGQWSIANPDGTVNRLGPVILNSDGSFRIAPKPTKTQTSESSNTTSQKKPEVSSPTSQSN